MPPLNKSVWLTAIVFAVLAAAPDSVWAQAQQGPNDRPLTVTASTFAGYDSDLTATATGPGRGSGEGAAHAGARLSTAYSKDSEKLRFYSTGSSEVRYYRADSGFTTPLSSGAVGAAVPLGRRLWIGGSAQGSYYPRFQFSVLPMTTDVPVDVPLPTLDYSISSFDVVAYSGAANATYSLDSRSTLSVNYSRTQFRYLDRDYRLNTQTVGAGYSRSLTRYATLRLGYTHQTGDYLLDTALPGTTPRRPTIKRRTIDAGINYSRPLSLSRRTTVGFSTGSTALDRENQTFYTLTGGANLNHQLARTWNLGLAYARRVGLVGGFNEPIFSDSTSLSIGGLLGRRVTFGASSGYANGRVGFASRGRNYDSFQATARVEVPIARRWFLFTNYFYYQYKFDEQVALPAGLAPSVNRHGVRAGLALKIF